MAKRADYRIVCVERPEDQEHRGHILAVGAVRAGGGQGTERMSVDEVVRRIRAREAMFLTMERGKMASVHEYACPVCGQPTIRSGHDAITENNLDNLRHC